MKKCPVCEADIEENDDFCKACGTKLIETDENTDIGMEVPEKKLAIDKDKIILLDLNYTLIANSKEIWNYPLDKKIASQKYEMELIDLIKDNYVILITASPQNRSEKILEDLKEKTGFVPDESFWNFGKEPPELKKYWMETEIMPKHGNESKKYLAIESNPKTRSMYKKLGIEARPKE